MVGIVLAAGCGRRIGAPKALLPLPGGRTFLEAVLDGLEAARPEAVVVVVGPWWEEAAPREARSAEAWPAPLPPPRLPPGVVLAVNPDPDRGQVTSIRCGLAAAGVEWSGAVLALVDHPLVRPATYAALAAAHEETPDLIVVPVVARDAAAAPPGAAGRRGHPVVFPEWAFAELAGPAADAGGARAVVRGNASRVRELAVDDPWILVDVDTREGYLDMMDRSGRAAGGP